MRILSTFPHADPAVQLMFRFHAQGAYVPNQDATRRDLLDIDAALQGIYAPDRPGDSVTTACQILRSAIRRSNRFIFAGGVW